MAKIVEIKINLKKFHKLLKLEEEKKRLELEIAAVKEEILPALRSIHEVECDNAKILYQERSNWQYSAKVAELEGQVKARKEYEQSRGIAKPKKSTAYVRIEKR